MDEFAVRLLDRLVDKTLEDMKQEERLAFIEKLFLDLSPADQQVFLLNLSRKVMPRQSPKNMDGVTCHSPLGPTGTAWHVQNGPEHFGPWQMCCRMMTNLVQAPHHESVPTASMARMFMALADKTRLKIVKLLNEQEYSVDELVRTLDLAQSTTSHHLKVLRDAGLVRCEKRGRSVYYSLVRPLEEQLKHRSPESD